MPLFSLSRLLIFEEKEAHREKMHAQSGSHKIILLREPGATIILPPATVDSGYALSGCQVAHAMILLLQFHILTIPRSLSVKPYLRLRRV